MKRLSASLAFVVLVACGSYQLVEVQDLDTLYFGTARQGAPAVTDVEWKAFVDEVITPAYPGFTEWTATGHWRGAEEATHVVQIAHLSRRRNDEQIIKIIREYKKRFQQDSVMWIRGRGLVAPE